MLTTRVATKADLNHIANIEQGVFRSDCYPSFFFRQAFDCWPNGLLVAERDTQVAGYALCVPSEVKQQYWLLSLAVLDSAQGNGIGKALTQAIMASVPGGASLRLTVAKENVPAYALYVGLGFTFESEEADYFGKGHRRDVLVWHKA